MNMHLEQALQHAQVWRGDQLGVDLFSVSKVPVWIRALAWGSLWKTVDSIDFSGLFRK